MLNYVWMFMLIAGFLISILNGRLDQTVQAALTASQSAVELSIGLTGIICLWSGLMNIAQKSGMIKIIARLTGPILKILFPQIAKNDRAMGAIVMNLAANFLGLGNAATPLGIRAMNELQKVNKKKDTASDPMCMFLVLNTSAIQLIPTTIIAIRSNAGSAAPSEITACVWVASLCATIAGVVSVFILSKTSSLSH
jgi:spore maturation protein A